MKTVKLIIICTFLVLVQHKLATADIFFVDSISALASGLGETELGLEDTGGEEGEFEIFACVTESDGTNSFLGAEPDFNNLSLGDCGGLNCIMGLFDRLISGSDNPPTTCFWDEETSVIAAGLLRYGGVRQFDPIFDVACDTGVGNIATSPNVNSPEGSFIIRIFGSNDRFLNPSSLPGSSEFGRSQGETSFDDETASFFMYGEPMPQGGIAEEISIEYETVDANWRACAFSLIMDGTPPTRAIPTMNEWGMIAFVLIAGVSAVFFLRRRSQAV